MRTRSDYSACENEEGSEEDEMLELEAPGSSVVPEAEEDRRKGLGPLQVLLYCL